MRTIGKNRGLARLADADGHFRMVALDQRPPLFDAIAKAKGITREQVEYSDVTAAKRLLVENLAPHCSSMLFDPNFAVPAAIDLLPPRCGLIMTLEEHRVEESAGGRKSRAITNWSVEKIRAMGGDAVKVLAWYRPDADAAVNEHQKNSVRDIVQTAPGDRLAIAEFAERVVAAVGRAYWLNGNEIKLGARMQI